MKDWENQKDQLRIHFRWIHGIRKTNHGIHQATPYSHLMIQSWQLRLAQQSQNSHFKDVISVTVHNCLRQVKPMMMLNECHYKPIQCNSYTKQNDWLNGSVPNFNSLWTGKKTTNKKNCNPKQNDRLQHSNAKHNEEIFQGVAPYLQLGTWHFNF